MSWFDGIDWKSIGDRVIGIAPALAGALSAPVTGPFAPLVTVAASALIKALGLGEGASQGDIENAILSGSPETLLALRKADQEFAVKMEELGIKREEIEAGDRDSARKREAAVKDATPSVLAFVIIGAFVAAAAALLMGKVVGTQDANTAMLVGAVFGYLSSKADTIMSYYFGSSSGSKLKTDALASIAKKGP